MKHFTYMSLGGGVQSGTMAEMIAESELPCPDVVIFADTGDEPQYVYDYVEYIKNRLGTVGVPVEIVRNGNLVADLLSATKRFAAIPAHTKIDGKHRLLRRQCTKEYKIVPIEKHVRQRLLEKNLAKKTKNDAIRVKKGISVECWLGISLDEVQRMKRNKTPWIQNRWPLIEKRMTRHDCQSWLEKKNYPYLENRRVESAPFTTTTIGATCAMLAMTGSMLSKLTTCSEMARHDFKPRQAASCICIKLASLWPMLICGRQGRGGNYHLIYATTAIVLYELWNCGSFGRSA